MDTSDPETATDHNDMVTVINGHKARHITGGADIIATATSSAVGLCPILSNTTTTYLNGQGAWTTPPGATNGDVVGPSSSLDNQIVRFDSTTGKIVQVSLATIDDNGAITIPTGQDYKINNVKITTAAVTDAVAGPASATDNAVCRYDNTTGKLIQDCLMTVDDSGSVNIPTGQTYKINSASLTAANVGALSTTLSAAAKRAFFLSGAGGWTGTTAPDSGFSTTETGTNKVNLRGTKHAASAADTKHECACILPGNFASGAATVTAQPVVWTASTDASSHTIIFGLQGVAFADGDATDTAYGTAQESTITAADSVANKIKIGAATSAITIAGSPDGNQWCQWRWYRKGDDTHTGDVYLLGWIINYTTDAFSDS